MLTRETTFEVMETRLGNGRCVSFRRFGKQMWPSSEVYVCPKCGLSWGKVHVDGSPYLPIRRLCPSHGPGYILPTNPFKAHIEYPKLALRWEILAIGEAQPRSYVTDLICQGL